MKPTRRLLTTTMLRKKRACFNGITDFQDINGGDRMWVTVAGARALYDSLPFSFLNSFLSKAQARRANIKTKREQTNYCKALLAYESRKSAEFATINDKTDLVQFGRVWKREVVDMHKECDQNIAAIYAKAFIDATPRK